MSNAAVRADDPGERVQLALETLAFVREAVRLRAGRRQLFCERLLLFLRIRQRPFDFGRAGGRVGRGEAAQVQFGRQAIPLGGESVLRPGQLGPFLLRLGESRSNAAARAEISSNCPCRSSRTASSRARSSARFLSLPAGRRKRLAERVASFSARINAVSTFAVWAVCSASRFKAQRPVRPPGDGLRP